MSIKIKYKNQEIYSNNEDAIITLPTSGSVVEGDFTIEYLKDQIPIYEGEVEDL